MFVVSGSQMAELFQAGEAAFNAVTLFIEFFIVGALLFAIGLGRNDHLASHRFDMFDDGVRVIAFVGQHRLGSSLAQQGEGLGAVVDVSTREEKAQRLAELIAEQMNLGGQTSSGTPQSLVRPPFLRPVAACWWARTMVESNIRYWSLRSRTNSSKIRSQTPL